MFVLSTVIHSYILRCVRGFSGADRSGECNENRSPGWLRSALDGGGSERSPAGTAWAQTRPGLVPSERGTRETDHSQLRPGLAATCSCLTASLPYWVLFSDTVPFHCPTRGHVSKGH